MNEKTISLANTQFENLENLLIKKLDLERDHQAALKRLNQEINTSNAKLGAALSMIAVE